MATKRAANTDLALITTKKARHHHRKRTLANAVFGVGNRLTKGITELAEDIFVHLDIRTLYALKTSNIPEFYEVIDASARLRKKLSLTQPTFEEAVALGLIEDDPLVASPRPGEEPMLLNPFLFNSKLSTDYGKGKVISARFHRQIIALHKKGESAWEQMFTHTKTKEDYTFFSSDIRELMGRDVNMTSGDYRGGRWEAFTTKRRLMGKSEM